MKPALFYAVTHRPYGPRDRLRVVAVTSEKSRRWYGREGDEPTNGTVADLITRFQDEAVAQDAARLYGEAYRVATPKVAAAELALNEARTARDEAAMAAISDLIRRT